MKNEMWNQSFDPFFNIKAIKTMTDAWYCSSSWSTLATNILGYALKSEYLAYSFLGGSWHCIDICLNIMFEVEH